ncbi:hypothetical protein FA15DRAFT_675519 [Coprinopsis marcescibilis]|uniref:Nucleic acid-binding protein n=1 Tax=Coprinopsis marcescibilis TaxID=230819 RepID=A0A5C3KE49_COPMA|nr:hypothetical protein FA15DRAFT_675519 [Coprinopsis marcescibilis]
MYRVFLGAPAASSLDSGETYHWRTISSKSLASQASSKVRLGSRPGSFMLPPATLEAASRRISLIYENAIFDVTAEEEDQSFNESNESYEAPRGNGSTVITWPPTEDQDKSNQFPDLSFFNKSNEDISKASQELGNANSTTAFLDSTRYETQQSQSFEDSDASSIARFPTFHFNIHALAPLSRVPYKTGVKPPVKVNALLAVLEVEGPDMIRIKKGVDAGKEVGILKMILGDEEGNVCKLTAWREVAEDWGGLRDGPYSAKRGDIIHMENILLACEPGMSATLTASPNLKSKMIICYRTMAYTHEDVFLRPDLRLGESDPCVRKVAAVVRWFENMVGLPQAK